MERADVDLWALQEPRPYVLGQSLHWAIVGTAGGCPGSSGKHAHLQVHCPPAGRYGPVGQKTEGRYGGSGVVVAGSGFVAVSGGSVQ